METKILKIEGMSCDHCVKAIKNAVLALAGVTEANVSLKDKTAEVKFDPATTPLDAIKKAITDEDFEIVE